MSENSEHRSGKKAGDLVISIPEHVRNDLPDTFSIDEIGRIDLREAETIADEGLLFLKENDLIEGLDDFDLIPLKDDHQTAEKKLETEDGAISVGEQYEDQEPVSKWTPETTTDERIGRIPADETAATSPSDSSELLRKESAEGRNWIPIEELDWVDEKGKKWLPLDQISADEEKISAEHAGEGGEGVPPPVTVISSEVEKPPDVSGDTARVGGAPRAPGEHRMIEGFVESDDEYVIWDIPEGEKTAGEPGIGRETAAETRPEKTSRQKEGAITGDGKMAGGETEEKKSRGKTASSPEQEPTREISTGPEITGVFSEVETSFFPAAPVIDKEGERIGDRPDAVLKPPLEVEPVGSSSQGASFVDDEEPRVHFIDDRELTSRIEEKDETPELNLEQVTRGIVQFEEAPGYLLSESDQRSDREMIAHIAKNLEPDYEELFVDLDYIYRDEEIDYIHAAIVEEDYSDYIREIDEFSGTRGGGVVPSAVELLGLTADEFDTIEDLLFRNELKDVNLYDRYHLYEFGVSGRNGVRSEKQCRYLLPNEESLVDIERDSIESDVSSGSALIFEEDVSRISEELRIKTGRTDTDAVEIVEREISPEITTEIIEEPKTTGAEIREAPEAPPQAGKGMSFDDIDDITDRVIILDDEEDVDRFIRGLPEQKQVDMKTLLGYLDGLFEKLPEKVIKRFASSEYFDLYLKVLNELGV